MDLERVFKLNIFRRRKYSIGKTYLQFIHRVNSVDFYSFVAFTVNYIQLKFDKVFFLRLFIVSDDYRFFTAFFTVFVDDFLRCLGRKSISGASRG